jgi:hypothetical protein
MRDCASLRGRALQVERSKPTGNPSQADVMRLAVALFNKTVTPSQTYSVLANKDYDVRKPFMFYNCYELLMDRFPTRLEPTSVGTTAAGVERGGHGLSIQQDLDDFGVSVGDGGADDGGSVFGGLEERQSPANRMENRNSVGPAAHPRSRPSGKKAAKRRKCQGSLDETNDNFGSVSDAFSAYTDVFQSVSDRTLRAADAGVQAK